MNSRGSFTQVGTRLAIFALVLLAAVSTPVLAQGPPKLNLSEEQRNTLKTKFADIRQRMDAVRKDLGSARMDLFQQMRQYKMDDRKVQDAIKRINTQQKRLLMVSFDNQVMLRQVLNKDQFAQLGAAVGPRVDRRGQEMWGGGGPPGGARIPDISNIGLSDDQQAKIKKLFDRSLGSSKDIASRSRTETGNLRKLYLNYDLNTKKVKAQIDRVADAENDSQKDMVRRQVELRKILNEDQFNALSKAMRPPGPRPGGPGRPHDDKH